MLQPWGGAAFVQSLLSTLEKRHQGAPGAELCHEVGDARCWCDDAGVLLTSRPGSPAGPVSPGGPTGPGGPRSPAEPGAPCFPGSP